MQRWWWQQSLNCGVNFGFVQTINDILVIREKGNEREEVRAFKDGGFVFILQTKKLNRWTNLFEVSSLLFFSLFGKKENDIFAPKRNAFFRGKFKRITQCRRRRIYVARFSSFFFSTWCFLSLPLLRLFYFSLPRFLISFSV